MYCFSSSSDERQLREEYLDMDDAISKLGLWHEHITAVAEERERDPHYAAQGLSLRELHQYIEKVCCQLYSSALIAEDA
jgi:hypothetical protein